MAINFTPDDVASGFNLTKINSNFDKVDVALQDALSRSGTGPNQMEADIDLNSNDLLNVNQTKTNELFINGALVTPDALQTIPSSIMLKSVYDPQGKLTDAFESNNHDFIQAESGSIERSVRSKLRESVSVKDFGAVGDGVTDDTTAIQTALNSTATRIFFPEGSYRIVDSNLDGTPVLTSSVPNRTLEGPGRITATTGVLVAMRVSGDFSKIHLKFAGNNQIMSALYVTGDGCEVSGCQFLDLFAPVNVWQSIAIWANFDGGDRSILITGNTFRNIESIGDGSSGNGLGLSRAIQLSGNQNITKASIISNNIIDSVIGEEGDAIAVISFSAPSTFFDFPVLIANNTVTTWTRRAIKIQSNGAVIKDNLLHNTFVVDPGNMQHAISLIQGGDHVVDGNTLIDCLFGGQINLNAASALERVDNITITNNVITGLGVETTVVPIFVDSFGENVTVANNKFLCPASNPSNVIAVTNALSGYVGENIIDSASTAPYTFLASVNLLLNISSSDTGVFGTRTLNTNGDALGLQVSGSGTRSLTLYNYDSTLSVGEVISRIRFHQNDAGTDIVTASIRAVAVDSSGSTKLALHTGTTASPDVARWNVEAITGDFSPELDNTYDVGTTALRVAQSHVVRRHWTATVFDAFGTGTPEGVVTAGVGSTFRRTDGGALTSFYVKETGAGNTGWVAK